MDPQNKSLGSDRHAESGDLTAPSPILAPKSGTPARLPHDAPGDRRQACDQGVIGWRDRPVCGATAYPLSVQARCLLDHVRPPDTFIGSVLHCKGC
jgi:hypothetical protein